MQRTVPSDELLAFARALRTLRRERELSQEALAYAADIHPKHLSDIERANKDPRLTTVLRLAHALGIEPAELLAALSSRLSEIQRSEVSS